jgi:DNA mismatch repair protein MutS2
MLEEFKTRGSLVITTTHNEKVKMFVQTQTGMKNAGMEFRDRPTYRLILDLPQASNALSVARELGVEERLLERARGFLDPAIASFNKLLEQLAVESTRAADLSRELAGLKEGYEEKVRVFEKKSGLEQERMRSEFQELIAKQRREFTALYKEVKAMKASKVTVKKVDTFLAASEKKVMKREPYHPEIGELVRAPRYNFEGEVLASQEGQYLVGSEKMKMWLPPDEIEPSQKVKKVAEPALGAGDFVPELHLRGRYRDDVFPLLERFIYEAVCHDQKELRIVHGKGQGILRQAVIEFLKTVKEVKSFRPGGRGEGGDGVTVVELK